MSKFFLDESYEEYVNRMILESVQYRPDEEENEIEKYMNYEIEEEKPKNNKSLELIGKILDTIFSCLFFVGLIGVLFWILGSLIGG